MATLADVQVIDIVKHVTTCIYNEMKDRWSSGEIKSSLYKDEVKRRFAYFMSKDFGLTWARDRRQMNNHLTLVFVRLNKKIRLHQKQQRLLESIEINRILEEQARTDLYEEFMGMLIGQNHHICPIDGYPPIDTETHDA